MRAFRTALAAILLACPAWAGAAPPAVAADNGDLRMEADVTYELQPDEARVHVTVEMRLTNLIGDQLRPDGATVYTVYESVNIPVPAEATNIAADRVGGGTLSTFREDTDDPRWTALGVNLSPDLRFGSPQTIEISYDLPDQPPRSDGLVRASPAYTLFPAYPVGDPEHASITVVAPDVFEELEVVGSHMRRSVSSDGLITYTADNVGEAFYATLAARNDDLLDEREITSGDHTFTLRYTPGDKEWADFAEDVVSRGVVLLEEEIGEPWPGADNMAIIESSSPHAFGYAGWFDLKSNTIEVSDQLDAHVMLHELAHAYFNHDTMSERWLREGFADLYADRVGKQIVDSASQSSTDGPGPSDADEKVVLTEWDESAVGFGAVDEFGYDTSWWAVDRIYDDIGAEAMAEVLTAAFDKKIPYASGSGEREELRGRIGRRRMLDLLEEVGGSENARKVYEELVLDETGVEKLANREAARATYDEFVGASDGWGAPYELREAMASWSFSGVDDLVTESGEILDNRDEVLAALDHLGVNALPEFENAYSASERLDDTIELSRRYTGTAAAVLAAQDRPDGVLGALTRLGEWLVPSDAGVADAAAHVSEGELAEARALTAEINDHVDRAPLLGGVVLAQALLCLMLLPLIIGRFRRRSRHEVTSDPVEADLTAVPAD